MDCDIHCILYGFKSLFTTTFYLISYHLHTRIKINYINRADLIWECSLCCLCFSNCFEVLIFVRSTSGTSEADQILFLNFQSLFRSLVQTTSSAFGLPPIHIKFHYEHRNQCNNVSQSVSMFLFIHFCLCELRLRLERSAFDQVVLASW